MGCKKTNTKCQILFGIEIIKIPITKTIQYWDDPNNKNEYYYLV